MAVILCILDGWGVGQPSAYNAIWQAKTPIYDNFIQRFPSGLIATSGSDVGLPCGQMGNSEVGHMAIGSGRIIYQDLVRIQKELENPSQNAALCNFVKSATTRGKTCHILGLLSDGGVHSHVDHIYSLAEYLSTNEIKVCIHAFLDGRDTPPKSCLRYINNKNSTAIKTISGRYYAMDRDNNWDRTKLAYNAMIKPTNQIRFESIQDAVHHYYEKNITDEFIPPTIIGNYFGMQDGDCIFIANFRPDRIRQIVSELLCKTKFFTPKIEFTSVLVMTKYFDNFPLPAFLPDRKITNTLGQLVAGAGMKQLRIAETEKYAHVTYFFNGGSETLLKNEEQIMIDSPRVATYNMQPEMSAKEITKRLVQKILSKEFDLIVVNYANADMVGHTGDFTATVHAIETVDHCLGQVADAALLTGATLLITADHGNAECMYNQGENMPNTAHTTNKVPFIAVDKTIKTVKDGKLCDIAPSILSLLKIAQPSEITGRNLIFL